MLSESYVNNFFTGFFVANTKCNILVAEGLTNVSFPVLLQEVFILPTESGRVLHNSCLVFNSVSSYTLTHIRTVKETYFFIVINLK